MITEEESTSKEDKTEKIVLHYIPDVVFVIASISCDEFDDTFSDMKQRDTIVNTDEIALLKIYMENLTPRDSFIYMDTRAKIYFISSSDTIKYCLDETLVYSNGIYYNISTELFDYIGNLNNDKDKYKEWHYWSRRF